MAEVTLKGEQTKVCNGFPRKGEILADFELVDQNLRNINLEAFRGKKKLIAIVPSLDTEVCSKETKKLHDYAKDHSEIVFLLVSCDLPFAQKRFCQSNDLSNIFCLSIMRNKTFLTNYGVGIESGPLTGIAARALIIVDEKDRVLHAELVSEITDEPDYAAAFEILKNAP